MHKKILVFGMDGNVINNYSIKASCAGKAMATNAKDFFNIDKSVKFFSDIYIETSGMNSLKQFKMGYEKIADSIEISEEILRKTEADFRKNLEKTEGEIEIFGDVKDFLSNNKEDYVFVITTTVPIEKMPQLIKKLDLGKYFTLICARNGAWQNEKIKIIDSFDKGKSHYDYILKRYNETKNNLTAISSTKTDIINAINYGIISIALEHIFNKEILSQLKPDYILEDCSNLTEILDKLK